MRRIVLFFMVLIIIGGVLPASTYIANAATVPLELGGMFRADVTLRDAYDRARLDEEGVPLNRTQFRTRGHRKFSVGDQGNSGSRGRHLDPPVYRDVRHDEVIKTRIERSDRARHAGLQSGLVEFVDIENRHQFGDIDVLGGQTTTQHVVAGGHHFDSRSAEIGVDVAGGQK